MEAIVLDYFAAGACHRINCKRVRWSAVLLRGFA
jgi:hypothetical protein